MDVTIVASDPNEIDVNEIEDALTAVGYFVNSITVNDRTGRTVIRLGRCGP